MNGKQSYEIFGKSKKCINLKKQLQVSLAHGVAVASHCCKSFTGLPFFELKKVHNLMMNEVLNIVWYFTSYKTHCYVVVADMNATFQKYIPRKIEQQA